MTATARHANRSGFTIIELIVVMVILAVMTGLAVPAFRAWVEEDDMTAATRRVQTLFRFARDSAVRSGTPLSVWIDSASARVWLVRVTLDSASSAPPVNRTSNSAASAAADGQDLGLPPTVQLQLSRARASFRFAPSGAVFADTLTLATRDQSRRITLDPWTGDVVF